MILNPFRRPRRLPGKLGAGLITGTDKIRCGGGNGDSLMLHFRHRMAAVAEATERFPQASRLQLEGIAAEAAKNGPPGNENDFHALITRARPRQACIHRTTLSGAVLVDRHEGPAAMAANNGDSRAAILASDGRTVLFQTTADMNFAGRGNPPIRYSLTRSRPLAPPWSWPPAD